MIKIHQEVYGEGQPIILIHGWAMHTGIWRGFARQLARQYQVTCLDIPGHGLSKSVEPYTLEVISDTLIEAIPASSFCLLGWSLGASIALKMAKKYPDRITSLICLAGNPKFIQTDDWPGISTPLLEEFAENLQLNCSLTILNFLALQVHNLTNKKKLLKQLKRAVYEREPPTERVLNQALDILKCADLRDDLTALTCPILIIQGEKDTLIPVSVSGVMQTLQPSSKLSIISNAGHVPFLSHPSLLINTIGNFV